MKVRFFAGGLYTTLVARIKPLANFLSSFGVDCDVITPINFGRFAKGKIANIFSAILTYSARKCVEAINASDVVLIGRSSNLQAYLLMKALKRRNVRVIFDLDDALFLPVGSLLGIKIRPGSFYLERMLKEADYVTVNGHYLLNYVKRYNRNTSIVNDPVDTNLFNPKFRSRNNDKVTITWEGSANVNFENLTMLVNPLRMIAKEYGRKVKFKIASYLGDQRVKKLFHPLEKYMEVDYGSERWLPMNRFARLIYDSDIMVSPLKKNPWFDGKSALRVGIAMAMGIPVVASPIGEQKYIVKHGVNGFFAYNEIEWTKYLRLLIEDEKLRRNMGEQARKTAERELSVYSCGEKLFNTIKKVLC